MLSDALNTVLKYTLAEHADFHRAIHEQPDEQTNHLVYADWLEENGYPEQAKHIRKAVRNGDVSVGPVSADAWANHDLSEIPALTRRWKGITNDGDMDVLNEYVARSAHDPTQAIGWIAPERDEPEQHSTIEDALKYTLADESDLHRAIREQPGEQTHLHGYADWLRDQGREGEADFVQASSVQNGRADFTDEHRQVKSPLLQIFPDTSGTYMASLTQPAADAPTRHPIWHLYDLSHDDTLHHLRALVRSGVTPVGPTATKMHREDNAAKVGLEDFRLSDFSSPISEQPTGRMLKPDIFAADEKPFKYAAVPEHDVHPDYQPSGIAPRVGHLLNTIASENTDAGSLAEGVLRTGDHSLLKILADKLADDGHELRAYTDGGTGIDLRHAERGMRIDRAVGHWLERVRDQHFQGLSPHFNQPAEWVSRYLSNRSRFPSLNRQAAVKELRKAVPDATKDDFHHSLMRHADRENVAFMNRPGHGTHTYVETGPEGMSKFVPVADAMSEGVPEWTQAVHNERLKQLGTDQPNPHKYPDTRPANKRYRLSDLVAKYAIHKSPAGGMVNKESPLAVTGTWVAGGKFTNLDTQPAAPAQAPVTKAKTVSLSDLLKRLRVRKTGA